MRWFLSISGSLPPSLDLPAISGVRARKVGFTVPHNARIVVSDLLTAHGVDFELRPMDRPSVFQRRDMRLATPLIHSWVPAFLTPYQKAALAESCRWPDNSGMFKHATGSGKTLIEILWALGGGIPAIIVTKAAVKRQYAGEVERFTKVRPVVIEGETPKASDLGDRPPIVIISYEILPAWIATIEACYRGRPTSVVFDESQKVASKKRWEAKVREEKGSDEQSGIGEVIPLPDGAGPLTPGQPVAPLVVPEPKVDFKLKDNVAAAAMRLSFLGVRRLLATATPITDRVRNLWAQLDLVQPRQWGSYWEWAKRYAGAYEGSFGMVDTGFSNGDELRARLSTMTHTVGHVEANRDLPPVRRIVTYIAARDQVKSGMVSAVKAAAKRGDEALRECLFMEAAARKRPRVMEKIEADVGSKLKTIVFTGRRQDCDSLLESCQKFAKLGALVTGGHGGHSAEEREAMRRAYMAHPGPAVLIGTGDAWGECIPANEVISGSDKRIDDYENGDVVFGETGVATCTDMKAHEYDGTMITVHAQGMLPITATIAHPVMTIAGRITSGRNRSFAHSDPTWRAIECVAPWNPSPATPTKAAGDFVLIPRVPGKFDRVSFDLAKHTLRGGRGRLVGGAPATLVLTPDLAWIIGLYVAEGSTTAHTDGHLRTTWSLSSEEHEAADRVIATLATYGIRAKKRIQQTWMHVTTGSIPLGRLLRGLCGRGATNKRVPHEILFHSDLDSLRAFLDGYAEGDGSISDGGRKVQAATVSRALALNLQLALARFGRLAAITPWKASPSAIGGRKIIGKPYFIVTWRWESKHHDRYKVLDRYIAVPVKAVERAEYRGRVASMTTTDSTFLVSNAVVHNGLNLQDTDHLLNVLLPWTPGAIIQREGRVVRRGMTRKPLIEYMIAEGTIDERVATMLLEKMPAVETVVGQEEVSGFARDLSGVDDPEVMKSLASKILGG